MWLASLAISDRRCWQSQFPFKIVFGILVSNQLWSLWIQITTSQAFNRYVASKRVCVPHFLLTLNLCFCCSIKFGLKMLWKNPWSPNVNSWLTWCTNHWLPMLRYVCCHNSLSWLYSFPQDIQQRFVLLVEDIFSFNPVNPYTRSDWKLKSITRETNVQEFNSIFEFLHTSGTLFKLIRHLMNDPSIRYDFPYSCLPVVDILLPSKHCLNFACFRSTVSYFTRHKR